MDVTPQPLPERKKRNVFVDLRKLLSDISIKAVRGAFQSANFIEGVTGWRLNANGLIEGTRLRLDNFIGRDDESIEYTGTWSSASFNSFYGGKAKISSTVGDTFTIVFNGSSIGVIAEVAPTMGKISFSLDGGEATLVDLYSPGATAQFTRSVVYSQTGLSDEQHTLVGTIATKNPSSSGNEVRIQGYVKSPTDGIKIDAISADIIAITVAGTTDGNGYVKLSTPSLPTGYSAWTITGAILDPSVMAGGGTLPKIVHALNAVYLYNGAATTGYAVLIEFLVSKT